MINAEAIELLQKEALTKAVAEEAQKALNNYEEGSGAIPFVVLPAGMNIADLEQYLPKPARMRREFETYSLPDFVDYVEAAALPETTVLINEQSMAAQAIIDFGCDAAPSWQQHKAHLVLDRTAAFDALLDTRHADMSQKCFACWLEDWAPNISLYPEASLESADADQYNIGDFISAVRTITVEQVRTSSSKVSDYNLARSELEEVAATSGGGMKLPASFIFKTAPYHGLPEREFRVRLYMPDPGSSLLFRLNVVQTEQHKQEITQDFAAVLRRELGTDMSILVGAA